MMYKCAECDTVRWCPGPTPRLKCEACAPKRSGVSVFGTPYEEGPRPPLQDLTRVKDGEASNAYATGFMVFDDPLAPTTDEQRDAVRAWWHHDFSKYK